MFSQSHYSFQTAVTFVAFFFVHKTFRPFLLHITFTELYIGWNYKLRRDEGADKVDALEYMKSWT